LLVPIAVLAILCFTPGIVLTSAAAQEPAKPSTEKPATPATPENPAQIELLETRIRFEADGSNRKEVHARVRINSELGVRQFARLNFDYNRAFESIEIPFVHITHPSGGTADILPSAISDQPNPAVVDAPAYHDVRVKSVRILGLQPGDVLEYRIVTTVSHHPLAPDFWMEHEFSHQGIVTVESFELDLPASRAVQVSISPLTPPTRREQTGEGLFARTLYEWTISPGTAQKGGTALEKSEPEVVLTTFSSWGQLAARIGERIVPNEQTVRELYPKAKAIVNGGSTADEWINSFYNFVSQKIRTIDLPLGATGFQTRPPGEILSSGYATPEDKFVLFAAIGNNYCGPARAGFVNSAGALVESGLPRPTVFDHLLTMSGYPSIRFWMDLNLEVAPYEMIPSRFQGKRALLVGPSVSDIWPRVRETLPFAAHQRVEVDAAVNADGRLTAKVHYSMRGDNELVLRVAFHQTPKEKWKELAQLLSITDGFRGQVSSVRASDPYATREPFTLDYEIAMPKFVDWSKKPAHIPALLPQVGLPDPPTIAAKGSAASPIELGTPLEVETRATLRLPPGTTARTPTGTSVQRDYATFASQYSAKGLTITASRHINFLLREIPADRAADYNAFLRAVQNDEAQDFTLAREATSQRDAEPRTLKPSARSKP
jgi:hypothetical protein